MITYPARSKIAALIVLFFLGTIAGQINHLLDTVRGRVEDGTRITAEVRNGVGDIRTAAETAAAEASALRVELEQLRSQVASGTATPAQVERIESIVKELKTSSGSPGPPGPEGASGPPGPPAAAAAGTTTTTAAPGGTTTTTRPAPTTSSTRPSPSSTTTTRCAVGVGALLKVGCR